MSRMSEVQRLPSPALEEIYLLIEQILGDELGAAEKLSRGKGGWKVALTRIRVKLSKVSSLCKEARKEILAMKKNEEDQGMEKYGVQEDDESMSKSSSDGCPTCGKPVEEHGDVKKCPDCGTEPFEGSK